MLIVFFDYIWLMYECKYIRTYYGTVRDSVIVNE